MPSTKEVILLNISGPDRPGITTTLTHILAQYDVSILDIGQAVIHDELALGILFEVPGDLGVLPRSQGPAVPRLRAGRECQVHPHVAQ